MYSPESMSVILILRAQQGVQGLYEHVSYRELIRVDQYKPKTDVCCLCTLVNAALGDSILGLRFTFALLHKYGVLSTFVRQFKAYM